MLTELNADLIGAAEDAGLLPVIAGDEACGDERLLGHCVRLTDPCLNNHKTHKIQESLTHLPEQSP